MLWLPVAAFAAPLEEITVSARKRDETVQDVPISIQALTAEEIDTANINDIADLANFAPGLALFENVDRGYGQIFIRGMQNTPPVGDTTRELASVFIDGIYYTGGVSGINTDNVERIEVIKGPQAALLGRSTFSGALNFVSRTPGNDFAANVGILAATDSEYRVTGYVEGPLVEDKLAGRVSARYREFGGQYTNSFNGAPLGEEEDQSVTGQLYFTPTDWFRGKLTATYQTQEDGPPSSTLTGKVPVHNFTSPSGVTFVSGTVPLEGPIAQNAFPSSSSDLFTFVPPGLVPFDSLPNSGRLNFRETGRERDYWFVSLDATFDLGNGYELSYLGGFSDEEAARTQDFELSAEENYFLSRRTDSTSSSHELRLTSPSENRFRWLAGLYYLEQELYERDPGPIFGPGVFGFAGLQPGQVAIQAGPRVIVDRDIVNTAVFGSVAYDVTEQLTLTFEGRYQIDDLEDTVDRSTGQSFSGDTKSFLPRLTAEYQFTDDVLFYLFAAKGIRPTTINSQYAGRTDAEKALIDAAFPELDIGTLAPEEEIWSYELGAKTRSLDGRLTFNANVYYSDWTDRQDLRSLLTDLDNDGLPDSTLVTVSGPDVDVYGVEIETNFAITENWYAGLVAALNKTELTGSESDATQARFFLQTSPNGERLPQTPELSATAIAQYTAQLGGSGLEWFARGEGVYVGSRYASTLNIAETGDSFDMNVRLGLQNERYSAVLFVQNLFDDDTFESLRGNADCATTAACATQAYEAVLPRQRQVGLTLQARF
ncbi:MAG: TonB-dependent receptor [Gammaproteobacteria bacterium]|nr:TonB-dependent receptor [Gammaproteobacteria bacterium]